jgi:hypothetical protein
MLRQSPLSMAGLMYGHFDVVIVSDEKQHDP